MALSACGDSKPDENLKKKEELPKSATVTGDNTSLRISPLTTASEIDTLAFGTKVAIKRRGVKRVRIHGFNRYWYFVRLESGMEGWVYGARLSVEQTSEQAKQAATAIIEGLRTKVIGKWWEVRKDGSTGYRKLYFWKDGKYKYGYGTRYSLEGKYELLPHEKMIFLDKGGLSDKVRIKQVGRDLRLEATYKGSTYSFRKGDSDPDSKEVGLDDKKKK